MFWLSTKLAEEAGEAAQDGFWHASAEPSGAVENAAGSEGRLNTADTPGPAGSGSTCTPL